MKKTILLLTALFLLFTHTSFTLPSADIVIEVNNLRNNKGSVLISLFNNEDDFPENAEKAIEKAKVEINGKTAFITFKNIPQGQYAAAILHDENKNLKMDFNFLGIPKEGYGFSNNAKGLFGPPHFNKAAFEVGKQSKKINIKAIYF